MDLKVDRRAGGSRKTRFILNHNQDLDQVNVDYIDKYEIINPVPIVWWDSPVLYLYLMLIHTKSNMHAAGLGVRRDVRGVHEFFSLISGTDVILENEFVDLTSLAVLAVYKFHSKKMTAMGVQALYSIR